MSSGWCGHCSPYFVTFVIESWLPVGIEGSLLGSALAALELITGTKGKVTSIFRVHSGKKGLKKIHTFLCFESEKSLNSNFISQTKRGFYVWTELNFKKIKRLDFFILGKNKSVKEGFVSAFMEISCLKIQNCERIFIFKIISLLKNIFFCFNFLIQCRIIWISERT